MQLLFFYSLKGITFIWLRIQKFMLWKISFYPYVPAIHFPSCEFLVYLSKHFIVIK